MIFSCYVALVCAAAAFDVWRLRIPNPLTLALAGLFLVVGLLDVSAVDWASHLLAGLLVLAGGAVLFRFGLFGGGDVKLWAGTSLWIGLDGLVLHLVLVAILGGLLAVLLLVLRAAIARLQASSTRLRQWSLPRALIVGEGIPYGVAIAGSSLLLGEQVLDLERALRSGP